MFGEFFYSLNKQLSGLLNLWNSSLDHFHFPRQENLLSRSLPQVFRKTFL